jgi:hypothetical protein
MIQRATKTAEESFRGGMKYFREGMNSESDDSSENGADT